MTDDRGRLYLGTTDRRVLSLDADKGKRRWKWNVGADVQLSPAIAGDKVLVAAFDAVLYAFHAGNGNLAWRTGLPSRPLSAPLVGARCRHRGLPGERDPGLRPRDAADGSGA